MCNFLLFYFFLCLAFVKICAGYAEKVSILFESRMKSLSQACVGEKVSAKIQVPLGENEPQNPIILLAASYPDMRSKIRSCVVFLPI